MLREDFSVSPNLRTTVMRPVEAADLSKYPNLLKTVVHRRLGLQEAFDKGMVHSWQYNDGSVRYTFQPD